MSILQQTFTLSNGVKIPKIGFGTWQIPNDEVVGAVATALRNGYLHIDTAVVYDNEEGVGRAVRESGMPRGDLFVTTKIPDTHRSYEKAKESIRESLQTLDIGYIDLLLIHSPKPWAELFAGSDKMYFEENAATWRAMEEAYDAGQVRAIGVSNFSIADLENLFDHGTVRPMANQIKYHIGWTQSELTAFCQENNILVQGFSPIATGKLLGNEELAAMAQRYQKSVPQLCIRYLLQKNVLPLPKSTHEEYIVQNADVDFNIIPQDMAYLDGLESI